MNFDFNFTAGASQNSIRKTFEGNDIYTVMFDGCEARDFDGKADPSQKFKTLDIKFSNAEGTFTHTVWEPKETDYEDRQGTFGPSPSNVKCMMFLFKHLIDAVNPTLGKEIDEGKKNLNTSSWDSLRQLMVKATEPGKGTQTKIKLVKNNKGVAIFPYFLNYSKEGKLYMSTNFIGNNIFWTDKERQKIEKAVSAKPTAVSDMDEAELPDFLKTPADKAETADKAADFDFNLL